MDTAVLADKFARGDYDELLSDIYGNADITEYQRVRYSNAIKSFETCFGMDEIMIFSAPGRSEIGGNHTDHQQGEVLAASINLDTIGVVRQSADNVVQVVSEGYGKCVIALDELDIQLQERETTVALIKGVLAGMKAHGHQIGGFMAYITSDVLVGAGLSSSAAYETLIGTIISGLYNNMSIPAIEIAMIGQYAENVYFGKPCGLMDQMACSVGGMVHINFADKQNPEVEKVTFDMAAHGYHLCITDTKGSHADLTADYAAIPNEMRKVAGYFGKDVLLGITKESILESIHSLREMAGDRAVLRALHFVTENERVRAQVNALKKGDVTIFLEQVRESGNSSYKYLQNVYANSSTEHQNLSLALAISDMFLGKRGVSRVHGGGFAGTIQAFVRKEDAESYRRYMDAVFGEGACAELQIRKYGGIKVI